MQVNTGQLEPMGAVMYAHVHVHVPVCSLQVSSAKQELYLSMKNLLHFESRGA